MLRTNNKITFTSKKDGAILVFDFVNAVEIETSYETLTDTATITIPKNVSLDGKPIAEGDDSIFKRGDTVKIELGYFPNLKTVFEGYITTVNAKSPIIIECEDEMFVLKNTTIKKYSAIAPTLKQFLAAIVPDTVTINQTMEVNMGDLKFSNLSVCQIFDVIKREYKSIYFYFIGKVLFVGLKSNPGDTKTIELVFEENIIDDTNLEFQRKEDIKLKIKAISMNFDNSKTEVEVGDAEGALRTYHYYNQKEADMIKLATLELEDNKYTGFKGDLLTFGEPFIRHGDAVKLISYKFPAKNGTYQVISVKRSMTVETAYKQEIELGILLTP